MVESDIEIFFFILIALHKNPSLSKGTTDTPMGIVVLWISYLRQKGRCFHRQ